MFVLYDAGGSDASEYHDNGIGIVQTQEVMYWISLNKYQHIISYN